MEDIYNDLENYDDVDLINQLRTENAELKHKLGECNSSMEQLQKDFDKLSAEFKTLETNYSSLLKIARTEIKRKTDMIVNLNIEKDMLVIKAMQSGPRNVQKLVRDVHAEALRQNKKKRNTSEGTKERDALIRKECERPPSSETSSTAIDNNNQMLGKERVVDTMTFNNRLATSEKQVHNRETFPDHSDGRRSPILDKRLSSLARQRFSKLSSDEEFEDMYSALEPKPTSFRGPDRSRKRRCDDSQDTRTYYRASGSHEKPSSYPDPFKENFNKNRTSRFSDTDRNIGRDKSYNDSERNINRDKYDLHYRKYSPERRRWGARDYSGDRRPHQRDRHRRLESPPRQRYQHRSSERRAYYSPEREEQKQDIMYNYSDTHVARHNIQDEYDEPQSKRPKMEFPSHHDDRRQNEKHYSKEIYSRDSRNHTCQSPDFSHTENESCNESVREIRSTASTVLEDPRLNSTKYVKRTEGNRDVLCTANADEIDLQPLNKSLWDLQIVQVPKALTSKPLEISEVHVDEMDVDKPQSILSVESGEVGSESTDTFLDDFNDYPEVSEGVIPSYKYVSNKDDTHRNSVTLRNSSGKDKENSPIDNTSKDIACETVEVPARHTITKSEKHSRTDQSSKMPPKDGNKVGAKMRSDSTEKSSVLHTLIQSVADIPDSPDCDKKGRLLKNTVGKEYKRIPKLKISYRSEKESSKSTEGKEHTSVSELKTSNKSDNNTSKNTDKKDLKSVFEKRISDTPLKTPSKKSEGNDLKIFSELKTSDNPEKETLKSTEGRELRSFCELKSLDKSEKKTSKRLAVKEPSGRSEKEKDHKRFSVLKQIDKTGKETSKSTEDKDHKSFSSVVTDSSVKNTDNNVSIFREFEHRVFSTRHIVEGDLELSDETNDETKVPLKIDEKVEVKKKQKVKRKPHRGTSKDKHVDLEDTTRKTRSKKDKEKELDAKNKFSELFGDSSSLITPEELVLATKEAHALPADCCPPLCEDALDGIGEPLKLQTQTAKVLNDIQESKVVGKGGSTIVDDNHKPKSTKDSKPHTHHKKHKDTDSTIVPSDTHTNSRDLPFIEGMEPNDNRTRSCLAPEVQVVLSSDKLKQVQKAKMTTDINTSDLIKQTENPNDVEKSNKKRKDEKRLSTTESTEENHTRKSSNAKPTKTLEANSNKPLVTGDNKENTSCNDNSDGNISGEMARIFEDTLVSDKITSVDSGKVYEEKLKSIAKSKETSTGVQDIMNLAPVIDEPGLVKTVVISTGIQPLDSTIVQYTTPLNALATSTPAKEPTINTSDIDSKINHTTCVNVTIASEDSVSQPDTDAPDMRITYYKRRRKVMKR